MAVILPLVVSLNSEHWRKRKKKRKKLPFFPRTFTLDTSDGPRAKMRNAKQEKKRAKRLKSGARRVSSDKSVGQMLTVVVFVAVVKKKKDDDISAVSLFAVSSAGSNRFEPKGKAEAVSYNPVALWHCGIEQWNPIRAVTTAQTAHFYAIHTLPPPFIFNSRRRRRK